MTKKCPYCVAEIPAEARKCKFCGEWVEKPTADAAPATGAPATEAPAKLVAPFTTCPSCNTPAPDGALLCVQCGYDVRLGQRRHLRYQPPAPPKEAAQGEPDPEETAAAAKRKSILIGSIAVGVALLLLLIGAVWHWSVQRAEYMVQASQYFKEVGLALRTYQEKNNHLPGNIVDPQGKALLSWRVELLPFLGQEKLYQEFKRDEPWDSEHNRKLIEQMPKVYASGGEPSWLGRLNPLLRGCPPGHTFMQGFVGRATVFEDNIKVSLGHVDAMDGKMNTLALVDGETAVPWTQPQDLVYDPQMPLPSLGGRYRSGKAIGVLCDGTTVAIRPNADVQKLRAYITYDDRQPPDPDAVFGDIPTGADVSDFPRFWGPIIGGTAFVILLLVVFVRWWLVLSDK